MPKECSICGNRNRQTIEALIRNKIPLRKVGAEYRVGFTALSSRLADLYQAETGTSGQPKVQKAIFVPHPAQVEFFSASKNCNSHPTSAASSTSR
jgi:hypothetical protein